MKTPEPQDTIWDDSGDFWVIESVADGIAYAQKMYDDKLISSYFSLVNLLWTGRFGGTWLCSESKIPLGPFDDGSPAVSIAELQKGRDSDGNG